MRPQSKPALLLLAIVALALFAPLTAFSKAGIPGRQKVIDFEDEIVEGLNKRPLDSLNQVSDNGKKKRKPHLYRKRVGFRSETTETLRDLRYSQ